MQHCGRRITGSYLKNLFVPYLCATSLSRGVVENTAVPCRPIDIGLQQCNGEDILRFA
jgi:hypothetical protein